MLAEKDTFLDGKQPSGQSDIKKTLKMLIDLMSMDYLDVKMTKLTSNNGVKKHVKKNYENQTFYYRII